MELIPAVTKEIHFQTRWKCYSLDDILVKAEYEHEEYKIAIEVKRKLKFSSYDKIFKKVVGNCWETFKGENDRSFNKERDKLVIALGQLSTEQSKAIEILKIARTSISSDIFFSKINEPSFILRKKNFLIGIVRKILIEEKQSFTEIELWQFLKCLFIIHFDLEEEGSQALQSDLNTLKGILYSEDISTAQKLFHILTPLVAEYEKYAGSFDRNKIVTLIGNNGIILKDHPNHLLDLQRLRNLTESNLTGIRNIEDNNFIPIEQYMSDLISLLREKNTMIIIRGTSEIGRPIVLKHLVEHLKNNETTMFVFNAENFCGKELSAYLLLCRPIGNIAAPY